MAQKYQVPIAPVPARVPNVDIPVPTKYVLVALNRLEKILGPLGRKVEDITKPVDECSTQPVFADNLTTVTVFPEYDKVAARVETVIVTGPPSSPFTLQLGDRNWDVATDVKGLFLVTGAGILLSRGDIRKLTATGNGVSPVLAANTGAAGGGAVNAALPVGASISGFDVTEGTPTATSQTTVTVTGVAGVAGGTLTYYLTGEGTATESAQIRFPSPLVPAVAGVAISVNTIGIAASGAVSVVAYGNGLDSGNWTLELTGYADERYYAA
jgi:hypothetical protein